MHSNTQGKGKYKETTIMMAMTQINILSVEAKKNYDRSGR